LLQVAIRKRLESDKSGSFTLDVAFDAAEGITILFGQSGSGKTTTLRAITGIITPDNGRICIADEVYFDSTSGVNLSIQKRRVGYVFQDYALFPHLTAEQNVAFGIKENGPEGLKTETRRDAGSLQD
jgi:molybdate transport system ATP-binding protein